MLTMQVGTFAEPSDWAVEFVEPAISDDLLPDLLRGKYQSNIKRYEYILIALEVLEQNNVYVDLVDVNPFTDIADHPYKNEIIKAYNADIVEGYEDNSFRPDAEIKREEVAALVYNLVKSINVNVSLPTTQSAFSDKNLISNWAIPFVEFNYTNSIILGTGKQNGLDTINPLGKTTREQAITLLYKVSKNVSLLSKYEYAPITIEGGKTYSSEELKITGQHVGYDILKNLQLISESDEASIDYISEQSVLLSYTNSSRIEISKFSGIRYMTLVLVDLEDINIQNDFKHLLNQTSLKDAFDSEFDTIVSEFKQDSRYTYSGKFGTNELEGYFDDSGDTRSYKILFKEYGGQ